MSHKISLEIFNEMEDVKEGTFDIISKKPEKVAPEEIKEAKKEAYRFFKHPVFFIKKIILTTIPFLLIIIGIKFIPTEILSNNNRAYISSLMILVAFTLGLRRYIYWRLNSYLVVPGEGLYIFKARNLFSLTSENVPFDKISTIDLKIEGMGSQIYGYGDIILASIITNKETGATIILQRIFKPKVVIKEIRKIKDIPLQSNI